VAWIPIDQALPTHLKTIRAAKLADVDVTAMIGHLIRLWLWAVDNAPDGDLDGLSGEEIEAAAHWQGEDGRFYAALIGCGKARGQGFIEASHGNAKRLHDWDDWGGKATTKRVKWRNEKAKYRQNQAQSSETEHRSPVGQGTGVRDLSSGESRRERDKNPPTPLTDNGFATYWEIYPRKVGRPLAEKHWGKLSKSDRREAIAAARNMASAVVAGKPDLEHCPHGSSFIGVNSPFKDWAEKIPDGYGGQAAPSNPTTEDRRIMCRVCGEEVTAAQMEEAHWSEGKGWLHVACRPAPRRAPALDLGRTI
jgi:hypothetical protein